MSAVLTSTMALIIQAEVTRTVVIITKGAHTITVIFTTAVIITAAPISITVAVPPRRAVATTETVGLIFPHLFLSILALLPHAPHTAFGNESSRHVYHQNQA